MYNLGFFKSENIGDIDIDVYYSNSRGDKENGEILSNAEKMFSMIGKGGDGIDYDKLKTVALQIIRETGNGAGLANSNALSLRQSIDTGL